MQVWNTPQRVGTNSFAGGLPAVALHYRNTYIDTGVTGSPSRTWQRTLPPRSPARYEGVVPAIRVKEKCTRLAQHVMEVKFTLQSTRRLLGAEPSRDARKRLHLLAWSRLFRITPAARRSTL